MFSSLNIFVLSNVIKVTFLSCSKASIAYVITLNPLLRQILTNNNNNDNDNNNNNNNNNDDSDDDEENNITLDCLFSGDEAEKKK